MGENKIKVFGDSEIVTRQVRNTIHVLLSHLKHYQHNVWELIKNLYIFHIVHVPRSLNYDAYLLANVASRLIPLEGIMPDTFSVELMYMPSVPDNVTNQRVFDDDQQIISFLHLEGNFKYYVIGEGQHDQNVNSNYPD
jgi:hypothetical protein